MYNTKPHITSPAHCEILRDPLRCTSTRTGSVRIEAKELTGISVIAIIKHSRLVFHVIAVILYIHLYIDPRLKCDLSKIFRIIFLRTLHTRIINL